MVDTADRSQSRASCADYSPADVLDARDPASEEHRPSADGHVVQFYEDDNDLARSVASFLEAGLRAGERAVVIATAAHRASFERLLESAGFELERLLETGTLTFLDAHDALFKFMRDGVPDPALFQAEIGTFIGDLSTREPHAKLRAYGEMVDVLWMNGQRRAALRLEELWNDLQARHPFTLLCAYSMASFYKEPAGIQQVCATHTGIIADRAADVHERNTSEAEPTSQHTRQLIREIAHRADVELALRHSLREMQRKEQQLRQSEQQLRDFVENAALGIHQVGPDGTILWVNRAELELLGYARDEYVGRSIIDVHADRAVIDDILERLNRGEVLHDREARLRAKDGTIKHVLITSNVHSCDGKFIHTRCFTRDITERRQAEEAFRVREVQLQTIFDALPVLVAYVNRAHRYEMASAGFERWFGVARAEIPGKHMKDIIGPGAYDTIRPYVERGMNGELVSYETEVPYSTGVRFVRASHIPQRNSDGLVTGVVSLVADITEAKNFEKYRAMAAERVERLLKITSALADAVTTDEVLEAVVDRVSTAIAASSVALWLIDPDGRTARLARSVGYLPGSTKDFEALPIDMVPSLPVLDAMRRAEPIWIPSQAALLREYPHLASATTPGRSYQICSFPLVSSDRMLGAIGVTIDEARPSDAEERSFLLLVARYAAQAIARLGLLEAERRSRAEADAAATRMGLLSHASRVFVDAELAPAERMEDIVTELGRIFGGAVGISLLESDGLLHTKALHHPLAEGQQLLHAMASASPVQIGEGVTGAVAQSGESVLIPAYAFDEIATRTAPAFRGFIAQYPIYALMCTPLRTRERTIGTVTVLKTRRSETYAAGDLELLEMLAERAASAIENARLHQDNLAERAHAEQLYRFAHAAASADEVGTVFEAGLGAIAGTLATDRVALLLFDEDGVMRFKAWRGLSEEYRSAVEGHSPWPRDTVAPQPVLVADVEVDASLKAYIPLFRRERIGSLAFIPLVTRGKLLGKFMVYYPVPHNYSTSEIELASAIGNHLASVTARFGAIAELERTLHYSELFAGVLAHDLRNPLGAIVTAAQLVLMRQEGEGDRNAKPLSRILSSSQRMARMIEQLLDFTRARVGGGIEIQARAVNMADLCTQAISELELVYPDRRIQCNVVGDQGGTWDPDRLLQIVSNLVANASQHGRPASAVTVRLDGRQPDVVVLDIHNEGAIAPELLPTLFDPFRGTRHRRDHSRGLGLGLFIVKELVRGHGGTVAVQSTEADGTTFTIRMPRHLN